jgi:hypothetical protein
MNMKKMVSCLVAGSMLTMAVSAFAQIPETQVSTIDNAAVVAFNGVNAHQSMNIEGDVYAVDRSSLTMPVKTILTVI